MCKCIKEKIWHCSTVYSFSIKRKVRSGQSELKEERSGRVIENEEYKIQQNFHIQCHQILKARTTNSATVDKKKKIHVAILGHSKPKNKEQKMKKKCTNR